MSDPQDRTEDLIVRLLQSLGTRKEVEQYLKLFSSVRQRFAVIKVSGGVVEQELDALASSIAFLDKVGLTPVVLHGAGPQLKAALAEAGVPAENERGERVVSERGIEIARRVFQRENLRIADALEALGVDARPVPTGVFEAELIDRERFGYAGTVSGVHLELVESSVRGEQIPILASLALTASGQVVNVNADEACGALARALEPFKVVFLSPDDGIRDAEGHIISAVNLVEDYEHLVDAEWLAPSHKKKLEVARALLEVLPLSSSAAVASPENLTRELFTHKGAGTLIRLGERVRRHDSLEGIDREKLRALLEDGFGRKLHLDYFDQRPFFRIYLADSYRATAILTREAIEGTDGVAYLDKFAVTSEAQGDGVGGSLWQRIADENPQLFWRARVDNEVNGWYFQRADGAIKAGKWIVFWYGIDDFKVIEACIQRALAMPATLKAHAIGAPVVTVRAGVVGGRGAAGRELVKLLEGHAGVELVFGEGARASPGEAAAAGLDVLFLSAPNGASAPYLDAVGDAGPVVVDLSADHRFDDAWVYGLPERNRARVRGARRISNPGCYATGAQLGLDPFLDVAAAAPSVFGVSGYSGAGSTPSPRNDPARLADNLLPYGLVDHTHEREIARHLGRPVAFMPHVAPFYAGITLTLSVPLSRPMSDEEAYARLVDRYGAPGAGEPLVDAVRETPEVRDARGTHGARVGGAAADRAGTRVALVVTLDNLLKGAATQAVQNMNLALGLDETAGIPCGGPAAAPRKG